MLSLKILSQPKPSLKAATRPEQVTQGKDSKPAALGGEMSSLPLSPEMPTQNSPITKSLYKN
jgi:hypothetical protein